MIDPHPHDLLHLLTSAEQLDRWRAVLAENLAERPKAVMRLAMVDGTIARAKEAIDGLEKGESIPPENS